MKLRGMVPVRGAEGGREANKGDGEKGQDDGGKADVWRCSDKGELNRRRILQEVLPIHGQGEFGGFSVDRVRRVICWRCRALDGGRVQEDGV